MTSAGAGTGHAIPGLVVTVTGTSISSGLDAAGRFMLTGVPSGDLQLQFSGPASGTIPVNGVKPTETITLVVTVTSSTVELESAARRGAGEEQLEGRVESLPPTMPAGSLKVAGRTVTTTASTEIRHGSTSLTLADIEIGYRVHVKGTPDGSSLAASSIFVQNMMTTDGEDEEEEEEEEDEEEEQDESASIHGTLMSIAGSAPNLQLLVGTTTVRTSSSTVVRRRGDVQTLDELRLGMDLHVVGDRQADGSIDARMIQINDDATGAEVEIQGAAGGVSGTCPALTFGINGYSIRTNGSTTFEGVTCATMKSGLQVKVNGISQADGSILATSVKR